MRSILCAVLLVGCWTSPQLRSSGLRPDGIACVSDELAFQLPFEPGTRRLVLQGNDGSFSHGGRYRFSWDFEMPEDTVVTATADGIVVEVINEYSEGGTDDSFSEKANRIVVDHGYSRYSVYQHLRLDGALVKEGDRVVRGQPIGKSGNTGYSTEPHLHFAVTDHRNRSLPVCFVDVPRGVPLMNSSYARGLSPGRPRVPAPKTISTIPRDAFEQNGIELLSDHPAARWLGGPLVVTGRTTREGKRVVAWFSDRTKGNEPCQFYGDVGRDGRFTVRVMPDELGPLGELLNFAVSIEQPDGSYYSDYSVPMAVRKKGKSKPCAAWSR